MSMYGKKRIVLTKEGKVVKAGTNGRGGSWHHIGHWRKDGLSYKATVLTPANEWDRRLTLENSELLICQSKTELRERVWDMYA
jgi:hypothetical protein